jgi:hypothetical protein
MVDNKYLNGKIYKITNTINDDIYIGSTRRGLNKRFTEHKSKYKCYLKQTYRYVSYFKLFEKYGIENCNIILIKNYPCNSKTELEIEEGKIIRNNTCVNMIVNIGLGSIECKRLNDLKLREIIQCIICSGSHRKNGKIYHLKTKKHMNALKNNITYIDNNNRVKINNIDEFDY